MIVRTWHGIVPLEKGESFREYLLKTGIAEAKTTPGNLGASIENYSQKGYMHFYMVSYWENTAAVRTFCRRKPPSGCLLS